mmetsp:Transcript_35272/g.73436  ORF Transcript_35272/g.73436 Transcript_35272/m.73436 type:complete len:159 (-) Transcript_35272:273-749(-)
MTMAALPLHLRNVFLQHDNDTTVTIVVDNCRTHMVSEPLAFATLAASCMDGAPSQLPLAKTSGSPYFRRRRCRWESSSKVTTFRQGHDNNDRAPVLKRRIDASPPTSSGMCSLYNAMHQPLSRGPSEDAVASAEAAAREAFPHKIDPVVLLSRALTEM